MQAFWKQTAEKIAIMTKHPNLIGGGDLYILNSILKYVLFYDDK